MSFKKHVALGTTMARAQRFWVRVHIFVVQCATDFLANNEEYLVFLSIYEFFIDVSYLLGDGERFSGFDASLMEPNYAVRNITKKDKMADDC